MRYKAVVAYDGTDYNGWQKQINGIGIQTVIEKALEKMLGHACEAVASGRTDGGVHALGQVFHFDSEKKINLKPQERRVGYLFQNYALFPNMDVLENVSYALNVRYKDNKKAKQIAAETLEAIGLKDQLHKKPSQLSGGQQQRVAIARTLALNPDIILLDEPISALDVSMREVMKRELKEIQKKFRSTMIFITHDQEEAFFLSDRIMIMSEGKIEQIDTPREIYDHPANDYVQDFVVNHLDQKYESLLKCTGKKSGDEQHAQ